MKTPLLAILVRLTTLAVSSWLYARLYVALTHSARDDADFGMGLILFGLLILASAAWAVWDGTRRSMTDIAVIWSGVALGVGVLAAVRMATQDDGLAGAAVVADALGVGSFLAILVAAPSLTCGLLSAAFSDRRTAGSH